MWVVNEYEFYCHPYLTYNKGGPRGVLMKAHPMFEPLEEMTIDKRDEAKKTKAVTIYFWKCGSVSYKSDVIILLCLLGTK